MVKCDDKHKEKNVTLDVRKKKIKIPFSFSLHPIILYQTR